MSVDGWGELERQAPATVTVDGIELRRGSRVVLRPRRGADVFDVALAGRLAVVDAVEEDVSGEMHVAVVLEDDPGRDLGEARQPGHRFFFTTAELEPLAEEPPPRARVLVAGIGNVFLADDGFGVAVAVELARRRIPGVDVADFGIRGMDLAYALDDYDAAVLVDAAPRGQPPGTLYVIEPDLRDAAVAPEAHAMDPVKVLALARVLGSMPLRVLVVGCEPQTALTIEDEDMSMELSEPVRAAIPEAVKLVESLAGELIDQLEETRKERP